MENNQNDLFGIPSSNPTPEVTPNVTENVETPVQEAAPAVETPVMASTPVVEAPVQETTTVMAAPVQEATPVVETPVASVEPQPEVSTSNVGEMSGSYEMPSDNQVNYTQQEFGNLNQTNNVSDNNTNTTTVATSKSNGCGKAAIIFLAIIGVVAILVGGCVAKVFFKNVNVNVNNGGKQNNTNTNTNTNNTNTNTNTNTNNATGTKTVTCTYKSNTQELTQIAVVDENNKQATELSFVGYVTSEAPTGFSVSTGSEPSEEDKDAIAGMYIGMIPETFSSLKNDKDVTATINETSTKISFDIKATRSSSMSTGLKEVFDAFDQNTSDIVRDNQMYGLTCVVK